MSFHAFNKPRVGETARCKRCATVYVAETCGCPAACGVRLWPAGAPESGVSKSAARSLVADRSCEFCPRCWSDEERAHLQLSEEALRRNAGAN